MREETLLTFAAKEYSEDVERIRQQGYKQGYREGVRDTTHLFKFGTMDFEPKATNKICDVCAAEYFGTDDAARSAGWGLGIGEEFCPSHTD